MILVERGPVSVLASREPFADGTPPPDFLEFPSARRLGWSLKVHYRNDERSRFRRLPDGWLYVASPTGLECFQDLAAIIDNAHFTGLPAALDALEHMRLAAFVAYDERTEELQFGRSLDGFASLYFGGDLPAIVIGESNFTVARRLGPIVFSKADQRSWCETLSLSPEASFLRDVKRCFAGVRYRVRVQGRPIRRSLMAEIHSPLNQSESIALLGVALRDIFASYKENKIALQLSGGIDSRTLLVGLIDAVRQGILTQKQVVCVSVTFPGYDCNEALEIRRVATLSGFKLIEIPADRHSAKEARDYLVAQDTPPFPSSFMGLLSMREAAKQGAALMVSGHGGDELLDFDLSDVVGRPFRSRLKQRAQVRTLRAPNALVDELSTIAVTCFGRMAMRRVSRALRQSQLGGNSRSCHRLGHRFACASGVGYEATSSVARGLGLYRDAPLFRGPFLAGFDPVTWTHPSGNHYKAVARLYMEGIAPQVAGVPMRAAAFDQAIAAFFGERCDAVDTIGRVRYAVVESYRMWRDQVASRGNL